MARLIYTLSALDPKDESGESTWIVGLEERQIDTLIKAQHEVRLARLFLVKEIIAHPTFVFEGWDREGHGDAFCYSARPNRDYRSKTIELPPQPGRVFLVFVTSSGKIHDWRWEDAEDKEKPIYPEDWEARYGRQIWPKPLT